MRLLPIAAVVALATPVLLVSARGETPAAAEGGAAADAATALRSDGRVHVSIPRVSMETFAGLASGLVLADVVETRVLDEAGLMLRTEATLSVLQAYFGDAAGTVRVQYPGGTTPTRRLDVPAAPELTPGSRWLVFLGGPIEGDAVGILGLGQGCQAVGHRGPDGTLVQGHLAPTPRSLEAFVADALEARETHFIREAR